MLTFLIDARATQAGLGLAEPLLYPFREQGHIVLLRTDADEAAGRLEQLDRLREQMRTRLRRTRTDTGGWNLLFLLALPEGAPVLQPTLTDQLWALRRRVLDPLRRRYNHRPYRAIAVAVDALRRETTTYGPKHDAAARLRWKLDRWGSLRPVSGDGALNGRASEDLDVPGCFFSQDDLASLSGDWSPEHLNSQPLNQRFGELPAGQREALQKARRQMRDAVDTLWKKKTDAAAALAETTTDEVSLRAASPGALQEAKQKLSARLADLTDASLQNWLNFDPAGAARKALADTLGLASVDDGIALLRFPLQREPAVRLQRGKVQLTYLLAALAAPQARELRRRLAHETRYVVSTPEGQCGVVLTDARQSDTLSMTSVAEAYPPRLRATARRVQDILSVAPAPSFEKIKESESTCSTSLDDEAWKRLLQKTDRIGPMRHPGDDASLWRDWMREVPGALNRQKREADRQITNCTAELREYFQQPDTEEVQLDPLDRHVRAYRDRFFEARRALLDLPVRPFINDWRERMSDLSKEVTDVLICRPSQQTFWVAGALCFTLLLVLCASALPFGGAGPKIFWAVIGAGVTGVALLLSRRTLHERIRALLRRARGKAVALRNSLQQNIEDRKQQADHIHRAQVARTNAERTQAEQDKAGRERLLLTHHQRLLGEHYERGCTLRDHFSSASAFAQFDDASPQDDPPTVRPERPYYANAPYWLSDGKEVEVNASVDGARHNFEAFLNGLDTIHVRLDPSYT